MTSPAGLTPTQGRPLTGRHVLVMMVAFFGLIFTMNIVMLRFATSTFAGLETDSAYRESQRYNQEAEAAAVQAALGWRVEAVVRREGGAARVTVTAQDRRGAALEGLEGGVRLARPANRRLDREGSLEAVGPGRYAVKIPETSAGQWDLVITFRQAGERVFLSRSRVVVE